MVFWYFLKFKRRRICLKYEDSSGQLTTEVKEENISDAEIMTEDSQIVYKDNKAESGKNLARLYAILHSRFHRRKILCQWMIHSLMPEINENRMMTREVCKI
jgi:hypothetical protein